MKNFEIFKIIDYSEKSIAVIGDTKNIKESLKEIGGVFNPRLRCGAGWIFSKKKIGKTKKFNFFFKKNVVQLKFFVYLQRN